MSRASPCDETEWTETVELGWNHLAGADSVRILEAFHQLGKPDRRPHVYGEGQAAEQIVPSSRQSRSNPSRRLIVFWRTLCVFI